MAPTAPAHALRLQRWALVPADRERLGARIAQRFGQMIESGFVDEVRALQARPGLSPTAPSLRAVGYRQLWEHAAGRESLPAAIERARAATRPSVEKRASGPTPSFWSARSTSALTRGWPEA